ncbi:hypothetical protein HDU67_001970 [Dinochytrium kinnereticum]|nr:hypothetical protein HDU67_001970 [Dinochytrium kinnereticum]
MLSLNTLAVLATAIVATAPAALVSAQQTCGTTPYNPAQYSCTNGMLCPAGLVACGSPAAFSCYNSAEYCCAGGQIQQAGSPSCANVPPPPTTTTAAPGGGGSNPPPIATTTTAAPPVNTEPAPPADPGAARVGTKNTSQCVPASPGAQRNYCLKFQDDFDFLNFDNWKHDVTLRGGGNWEFQSYSNNRTNSFIRDGKLFIKPTLTSNNIGESGVMSGTTLSYWGNVEDLNSCTDNGDFGCMRTSDGNNIINPIQSAALRSVRSVNFRFGKVEIRAKLPKGDWIWPALWMLPKHGVYGQWPASGEIDIMESRGNGPAYPEGGYDQIGSTLHWGPNYFFNRYRLTHATKKIPDDGFHTYGLLWTPESIKTYIDDESNIVLDVPLNDFYAKGKFPEGVNNPWVHGCAGQAPFDQEFYIIMNVAIGGTAGYFPVGTPWSPTSVTAARDFWNARGQWLPTWKGDDVAMQVDSVKVWEMC